MKKKNKIKLIKNDSELDISKIIKDENRLTKPLSLTDCINLSLLVSPDSKSRLFIKQGKKNKKLTDGKNIYPIKDNCPILYPSCIRKMINKKKLIYNKNFNTLQQYFFLNQVKATGSINNSQKESSTRRIYYRIKKFCKNLKGIILDVGGGDPDVARQFLPVDAKYLCIDPFSGGKKFKLVGMGEILPISDKKIDVVLFNTSLDHILDYQQAIEESYRVLKKGGKIVICSNIWFNDASLLKDDVHFHHFRKSQIMSSLNKTFKVKRILNYEHPKKNVTNRFMMCLLAQKR